MSYTSHLATPYFDKVSMTKEVPGREEEVDAVATTLEIKTNKCRAANG